MSDTPGEFDQVDIEQEPSKLRQLLKQAAVEKKQLLEKLSALESAETQRAIGSAWNELKVPAAIRELYKGEQSVDAIKSWVEAARGFLNLEAAADEPETPELTPEQQAQHAAAQQFQEASAIGANAFHAGFETVQQQAKNAAEAYKNGTMSRADYDAAVAKVYEGMQTRPY